MYKNNFMNKTILALTFLIICTAFYACKKDFSKENYTPNITNPVKSDLTETVTTSVNGFVTDQNDSAIAGATVTAGTSVTTTDKYGYFSITNASLSKIAGFIKVDYAGYFTAYKTFVCNAGGKTFTRLKLIPKTNVGIIDNSTGGSVTTTDGGIVTLPANSAVVASNGSAYTGHVHVAAHWIDPTNEEVVRLNMPGDLRGVDTTNNIKCLESYGMLAVELTGDGGQLLQIATGQHATLSFPIPSTLLSHAPASIPLWSFDETNGLWKEEGTATKNGNNYVGNVPHFCYWNCDIPLTLSVPFKVQIVDSALNPLANTAIEIITASGEYTGCHGETDSAGFIYGYLPGNTDLTIQTYTPCGLYTTIKEFTSATTDLDLGTIKINNNAKSIIVTGTLLNCDSLPVANGFLLFEPQNGGYPFSVSVNNGQFNYSQLGCEDTSLIYLMTSYDYQNVGYSTNTRMITLNNGINNLGSFKECTNSSGTVTISYPSGGTYCTSDLAVEPVTYTGPLYAGTYSATASGLTIDAATGAITPSTSTPGTYTITYSTTALQGGGNPMPSTTVTITNCNSSSSQISLTSPAGTTTQNICINTAIAPITYSIEGGATGASVTGLPAGVMGTYSAGTVTISGTPATTVGSPYTYTVTTTGGSNAGTATGTITVNPNAVITLTTAHGTDNQTVNTNTPITNITYSTAGSATGISITGLPAGVTGTYAGGVVTISGTPITSAGSPYTYTVTTTGGCVAATATGTITVLPRPGYFNYTIDGVPHSLNGVQDSIYCSVNSQIFISYTNTSTHSNTELALATPDDPNATNFTTATALGFQTFMDPLNNDAAYIPHTNPITDLNLTQLDNFSGGYIEGTWSGTLADFSLVNHTITVQFRVRIN
jgi:hypothetical protein